MTAFVSKTLRVPLKFSAITLGIELFRTSKCKNTLGESSIALIHVGSLASGPSHPKATSKTLPAIIFRNLTMFDRMNAKFAEGKKGSERKIQVGDQVPFCH